MGADVTAFLLIDDNSPTDQPPFTNAASTWSLADDLGLSGSKDYAFFAAIGGVRNTTGIEPLFPWRGLPPVESTCERLMEMADDYNVSWLTLSEIRAALARHGVEVSQLSRYVRFVLLTMEAAEKIHGVERVRLVFQIID